MYGDTDYRMQAILGASNEASSAVDAFEADVDRAEARVEAFDQSEAAAQLTLDDEMFRADLEGAKAALEDFDGSVARAVAELESRGFHAEAAALQALLDKFDGQTATAEVELRGVPEAVASTAVLDKMLDRMHSRGPMKLLDERAAALIPIAAGDFLALVARSEALQAAWQAIALTGFQDILAALPALLSSAASGVGALATGLAEGVVGGAGLAATTMTLFGGSVAAAAIPVAGIVKGSLDMASALEEAETKVAEAEKGTQEYKDALAELEELQAQADEDMLKFADSVNKLKGEWTAMNEVVGKDALPILTEWVEYAQDQLPMVGVTMQEAVRGFTLASEDMLRDLRQNERQARLIEEAFEAVGESADESFGIIFQGARLVGNVFSPLIDDAQDLLMNMEQLVSVAADWSATAEGQREIGEAWDFLLRRAGQLYRTAENLAVGLYNVADALEDIGLVEDVMRGMEGLSREFREVTREGTDTREMFEDFLEDTEPALDAMVRLVGRVAVEFVKLADNVQGMKIKGSDITILEDILDSLGDALPHIRRALEQMLKETGPEIGDLIDNLAELADVAADNAKVWGDVLGMTNRVLRSFNNLDDDTQSLIMNLFLAQRAIGAVTGTSGGGGLVGLAANAAITAVQLSSMRRAVTGQPGILRSLDTAAANAAGTVLSLGKAGGGLTTFARAAGPIGVFTGALLAMEPAIHAADDSLANLGEQAVAVAQGEKTLQQAWEDWNDFQRRELRPEMQQTQQEWEAWVDSIEESVGVKDTVDSIGDSFENFAERYRDAGGIIGVVSEQIRDKNQEAAEGMVGDWEGASITLVGRSIIPDMVNAMEEWLVDGMGGIIDSAVSQLDRLVDGFQDAYNAIVGNSIVPDMVRGVDREFGKLGDIAGKGGRNFRDKVVGEVDRAKRDVEKMLGEFGGRGRGGKDSLSTRFEDMANNVKRETDRMRRDGVRNVDSMGRDIERRAKDIHSKGGKPIEDLNRDSTANLDDMRKDGVKTLDGLRRDGLRRLTDFQDDGSRQMEDLRDNATSSSEDMDRDVTSRIEDLAKNGTDQMEQLQKDGSDQADQLRENSTDHTETMRDDVGKAVEDMKDKAVDTTEQFKDEGSKKMEEAGKGMSEPIGQSSDDTAGYLDDMLQAMNDFIKETGIDAPSGGDKRRGKGAPSGGTDASGPSGGGYDIPRRGAQRYEGGVYGSDGIRYMAEGGLIEDMRTLMQDAIPQGPEGGISDGERPRVVYGEKGPSGTRAKEAYIREDADPGDQVKYLTEAASWFGLKVGKSAGEVHAHFPPELFAREQVQFMQKGGLVLGVPQPNSELNYFGEVIPGYPYGGGRHLGVDIVPGGGREVHAPAAYKTDNVFQGAAGEGTFHQIRVVDPEDKTEKVAFAGHLDSVGPSSGPMGTEIGTIGPYSGWGGGPDHVHWQTSPSGSMAMDLSGLVDPYQWWTDVGGSTEYPSGGTGGMPDYSAILEKKIPKPPDFPNDIVGDSQENTMGDYRTSLINKLSRMVPSSGVLSGEYSGGGSPEANRRLGEQMNADVGWAQYWADLDALWTAESGWDETADNPTSDAYGIPQALPGSKMASAGPDWKTNPATQIEWGLGYIRDNANFQNPQEAWAFHQANGWYTNGGVALKDQIARVGDNGPEFFMPLGDPGAARGFIDFLAQLHPRGFDDEGAMRAYAHQAIQNEKIDQRSSFRADRQDTDVEAILEANDRRMERHTRALTTAFRQSFAEQNEILDSLPDRTGGRVADGYDSRLARHPETRKSAQRGQSKDDRLFRARGPILNRRGR